MRRAAISSAFVSTQRTVSPLWPFLNTDMRGVREICLTNRWRCAIVDSPPFDSISLAILSFANALSIVYSHTP
ncbi:hypothetical protein VTO73DRAFT_1390 [Trametes versicolor]